MRVDTVDMCRSSRPAILPTVALARVLAAVSGVLCIVDALALAAPVQFATPLERSAWETRAEHARCVLRHPIPDFGAAEFLRVPAKGLQLRVDLPKPPVEPHEVTLRAVPPGWNHHAPAREFGSRLIEPGAGSLLLVDAEAQALFDALEQGLYVELAFGPVGGAAQAVVSLSAVRFLPAVPAFEDCVAALGKAPPRPVAASGHPRVAALAASQRDVPATVAAPPVKPPPAADALVEEDPYIRSDSMPQTRAASQAKAESQPEKAKAPKQDPGAGLNLVTELVLHYGPKQDGLSDAARLELGAFVREYVARKRGDLVLIAGSAADGAQTRRRALEIKGYLVRNGVPAARVLIHVQGEKLPQRDGQPVEPPGDASRMAVWQVR